MIRSRKYVVSLVVLCLVASLFCVLVSFVFGADDYLVASSYVSDPAAYQQLTAVYPTQALAQTFNFSIGGYLSYVSLFLRKSGSPEVGIKVALVDVGGALDGKPATSPVVLDTCNTTLSSAVSVAC